MKKHIFLIIAVLFLMGTTFGTSQATALENTASAVTMTASNTTVATPNIMADNNTLKMDMTLEMTPLALQDQSSIDAKKKANNDADNGKKALQIDAAVMNTIDFTSDHIWGLKDTDDQQAMKTTKKKVTNHWKKAAATNTITRQEVNVIIKPDEAILLNGNIIARHDPLRV